MKRLLYLLLLISIVSCKKGDTDQPAQNPGLIEGYLKENPSITVQKTNMSTVPYNDSYATSRGYHFNPLKDVKITEIGGRIAEKGIFKIKISNIDNGWSKGDGWVDVLIDSINITSTAIFQYKAVNKEVILLSGHKYLISYFNINHNSVYDAGTGSLSGYVQMPLTIKDIEIEREYYSYDQNIIGGYRTIEEGFTNGLGLIRGLVDFKYELAK